MGMGWGPVGIGTMTSQMIVRVGDVTVTVSSAAKEMMIESLICILD